MRGKAIAAFMGATAVTAVVLGFLTIDSPTTVRQMREDQIRLNNLHSIASALNCGDESVTAPAALTKNALESYCGGRFLPQNQMNDPVTSAPYRYERRGDTSFVVCAEFSDAAALVEHPPYRSVEATFDPATGCLSGQTR